MKNARLVMAPAVAGTIMIAMALFGGQEQPNCIPTVPEVECVTPADCEGLEHVMCVGQWECLSGQCAWNCDSCVPGPEVCDGKDNDCDGEVDEGCDECLGLGETFIDLGEEQHECCPGLSAQPDCDLSAEGGCICKKCPCMICLPCGDGVCGPLEHFCNCPEDCPKPMFCKGDLECPKGMKCDLETNACIDVGCVGEGELIPGAISPDYRQHMATECCEGLVRIDYAGNFDDDCNITGLVGGPGGACTKCGDGECGEQETKCNCPADCGCAAACLSDDDCDDGDECTVDFCQNCVCGHSGIPGCGWCKTDEDGDGYFDFCIPEEWDCDDSDPAVHPGAAELCNGIDDDCDGVVDEDCVQPKECKVSGCSGQVCAEEIVFTTCEWYPWYACYKLSECGPFGEDGGCAWKQTPEFLECMQNGGLQGN